MDPQNTTPESVRKNIFAQVEELRAQGIPVGIPMNVELAQSVLDAMRRGPAPLPISQDLARFSAKAGIAGLIGLGMSVAYYYITRAPAAMDLG
jgi:hypothetical protein